MKWTRCIKNCGRFQGVHFQWAPGLSSFNIKELTTRELGTSVSVEFKTSPYQLLFRNPSWNLEVASAGGNYGNCLLIHWEKLDTRMWNMSPATPRPPHAPYTHRQLPFNTQENGCRYCWGNILHPHNPFCHLKPAKCGGNMVPTSL